MRVQFMHPWQAQQWWGKARPSSTRTPKRSGSPTWCPLVGPLNAVIADTMGQATAIHGDLTASGFGGYSGKEEIPETKSQDGGFRGIAMALEVLGIRNPGRSAAHYTPEEIIQLMSSLRAKGAQVQSAGSQDTQASKVPRRLRNQALDWSKSW
ncbi:hypothetical protein GB937_010068 [Aspergillus fischeri]|nr:hypothetical protein GB937_010068 [Aspergillus fischeri]